MRRFCASDEELRELCAATPLVHGFKIAGPRPASEVSRRVRMHQAIANGDLEHLPGGAAAARGGAVIAERAAAILAAEAAGNRLLALLKGGAAA